MDHKLTFDPVTFSMWERIVPTPRKRKNALKNIESGTRVLFISPSPDEQPEEQPPKELPKKRNRQTYRRRKRQIAEKQ